MQLQVPHMRSRLKTGRRMPGQTGADGINEKTRGKYIEACNNFAIVPAVVTIFVWYYGTVYSISQKIQAGHLRVPDRTGEHSKDTEELDCTRTACPCIPVLRSKGCWQNHYSKDFRKVHKLPESRT